MESNLNEFKIVNTFDLDDCEEHINDGMIKKADLEDFLTDLMLNFVDKHFEIVSGNEKRLKELQTSLFEEAKKLINNELYYNYK